MSRSLRILLVAVCVSFWLAGCEHKAGQGEQRDLVYTEDREPCSDYDPTRNLYFGDLHAHTVLSRRRQLTANLELPLGARL